MSSKYLEASGFSRDTVDFLECLFKNDVSYVIVGGLAVIYYGHARLTGDIDIYYEKNAVNIDKLYQALQDFWGGHVPVIKSKSELSQPGMVFQFGVPPNRVDMMNQIEGVSFKEAAQKKETVELRAQDRSFNIHYIGIDALIKNKESVGRPRDLEDLKFLRTRQK
jgi:hypothetical protein